MKKKTTLNSSSFRREIEGGFIIINWILCGGFNSSLIDV
jgi:hypothetical protein